MSAKKIPQASPDFRVIDHGSIVMFEPISPNAKQLVVEHFNIEPWQWLGRGFAVDHRVAQDLVNQLDEEGFTIGG